MMADQMPASEIILEDQNLWHTDRQPAGCSHCHRVYLVPTDYRGSMCPLCRRGALEAQPAYVRRADPERVLPFRITQQALLPIYQQFISPVWIKPEGLNPESLLKNTRPLFWPLWLVDSNVNGHWQMEAGFDYQVESAKEVYTGSGWQSRQQIETRVRWEPRVDKISTRVDNVITPALDEHQNRRQMTGVYQLERGVDFDPTLLGSAFMELPDLTPEAAWPLARPDLDQALAKICQTAAGAQHVREFIIQARFENQNWTEFFLPLYATHYSDDEGQPQVVIVNAQSGVIFGPRLASRKRGQQIAGIIGAVADGLFLLALIGLLLTMIFPAAALIAGLMGILGLAAGVLAIIIAIWPGQWNRSQTGPRIAERP
jgi:hypothetical protein